MNTEFCRKFSFRHFMFMFSCLLVMVIKGRIKQFRQKKIKKETIKMQRSRKKYKFLKKDYIPILNKNNNIIIFLVIIFTNKNFKYVLYTVII